MAGGAITKEMIVKDVIRRHPETHRIFEEYGVDSCCGGGQAIVVAAAQNGKNLDALLEALNAALVRSA